MTSLEKSPVVAHDSNKGFTILELSIVLFIIAIVTGISVSSGISVVASMRLVATKNKMQAVENALMQYRVANNRLPCPGDLTLSPITGTTGSYIATTAGADYGLEAGADASSAIGIGTGVCTGTHMTPAANFTGAGATNTSATGAEGALPAITLGLPPDFMLDGWGNKFRYAVDISMTAKGAFAASNVGCTGGAITVNDSNGVARSTASIYALISHGANGHGAYSKNGTIVNTNSSSADKLTNCHCSNTGATTTTAGVQTTKPATYVQKLPAYDTGQTGVAAYYFDDLVSGKELWQMQTAWSTIGKCTYVYVADHSNSRIVKLSTSGAFIKNINLPAPTIYPGALSFDTSGNFWVTDSNSFRVVKYNNSGSFLTQVGCSGGNVSCSYNSNHPDGAFTTIYNATTDSSGNLWVTDNGPGRVQKFNSSGTWLMTIGGGSDCGGVATSSTTSSPVNGWATGCAPNAASCSCSSGTTSGLLGSPTGVAVDASGNIWVADLAPNNRIVEFNSSGSYVTQIGCAGPAACSGSSADGKFWNSESVTLDGSGNIWTTEWSTMNRIQKLSSNGSWLMSIGGGNNCDGAYSGSTCSSVNGYAFCCSLSAGSCSSCQPAGGAAWPNGMVNNVNQIAFDPSGNIWVADPGNNRVQEFSPSGSWLASLGGPPPHTCETSPNSPNTGCPSGSANGQFNQPDGIAIYTTTATR